MKFLTVLVSLLLLSVAIADKVRYDGFRVYKIAIENENQLKIANKLKDSPLFSVWKPFTGIGDDFHLMVNPKAQQALEAVFTIFNFKKEVLISNLQELIDQEQEVPASASESFGWTRYHNLTEIEGWLDGVLAKYPKQVTSFEIGKSYEGRTIRGIKISYKSGNPGIFIESNIHAREWITSATATYFINELLTSKDKKVRDIAENIDWYIVPVFNVDGFAYTHEKNRMWRKTRQPNKNSTCIGTDANRNFDSYWLANGGASANPCDETYAGSAPFSEPETRALSNFIIANKKKINIYLSFHSYGQYLLSPFGHVNNEFPQNYAHLLAVGKATTDAIRNSGYSTQYAYGSTGSVLYVASGTSVDWAFNTQGIKLGYTFEFRDKGKYGFILPPAQIIPNAEEAVNGIVALVQEARALNYLG